MYRINKNKGSILILALWALSFLSVLALQLGLTIRQKANLLMALEERSNLHLIASSGVKKAVATLRAYYSTQKDIMTAYGKQYCFNNENMFAHIPLGLGEANVQHYFFDSTKSQLVTRYGVIDEERKININTAEKAILVKLFKQVLNVDEEKATALAESIIGWREIGETQTTGFYSDNYYSGLIHPYESKDFDFELIDELLLVKGFTPEIVEQLKPFITIYGDGQVNINTAAPIVLSTLGLAENLITKILMARNGLDGIDSTLDDFIFQKTYDLASEMDSFIHLEKNEVQQLDQLNKSGLIKTNSTYFLIESVAMMENKKRKLIAVAVYNYKENSLEYYREK